MTVRLGAVILRDDTLPLTISHMSLSINHLVGYSQSDDGSRQ